MNVQDEGVKVGAGVKAMSESPLSERPRPLHPTHCDQLEWYGVMVFDWTIAENKYLPDISTLNQGKKVLWKYLPKPKLWVNTTLPYQR